MSIKKPLKPSFKTKAKALGIKRDKFTGKLLGLPKNNEIKRIENLYNPHIKSIKTQIELLKERKNKPGADLNKINTKLYDLYDQLDSINQIVESKLRIRRGDQKDQIKSILLKERIIKTAFPGLNYFFQRSKYKKTLNPKFIEISTKEYLKLHNKKITQLDKGDAIAILRKAITLKD